MLVLTQGVIMSKAGVVTPTEIDAGAAIKSATLLNTINRTLVSAIHTTGIGHILGIEGHASDIHHTIMAHQEINTLTHKSVALQPTTAITTHDRIIDDLQAEVRDVGTIGGP